MRRCSSAAAHVAPALAHATAIAASVAATRRASVAGLILPRRKSHEYSLRPSMPSRWILCCLAPLLASGCVFISGDINPFSRRPQPLEERVVSGSGRKKILLMDISGVITSEERGDALGLRTSESIVARVEGELQMAAADDKIAGVV